MKKIIGLTCQKTFKDDKWIQMINQDYITYVEETGAIPIVLPISRESIDEKLELIDGLILIGGDDINPKMYNEDCLKYTETLDLIRDDYEEGLIKMCLEKHIPMLGICRGMQMINVVLGGTLYQDNAMYTKHLPQTLPRDIASHNINIDKESFLYPVLGNQTAVNSFHHQSIKCLAEGLRVSAISTDGVIEAIEHIRLPIYGVQWHPEALHNNESSKIVYQFLEAIK